MPPKTARRPSGIGRVITCTQTIRVRNLTCVAVSNPSSHQKSTYLLLSSACPLPYRKVCGLARSSAFEVESMVRNVIAHDSVRYSDMSENH